MPLNRLKNKGACCILTLIALVFCLAQPSTADDLNQLTKDVQKNLRLLGIQQSEESKNNERHLSGVIQAFSEALASEDEEIKDILAQWDAYVTSVSHFSNTNYVDAINKQMTDYNKSITDIDDTIKESKTKRKSEYSSSWVDDLVNHFGIEFVKKNKTAIKYCLMAISFPDESFEDNLKDLIYSETMLFGSYKKYFGLFLTFYKEKLDKNAQKKIEAHKKIAENFLALIDKVSHASIYNTTVLLNILTENKARRLNNEVFTFLKAHPLSHTLRDSRALEDLKKVTDN